MNHYLLSILTFMAVIIAAFIGPSCSTSCESTHFLGVWVASVCRSVAVCTDGREHHSFSRRKTLTDGIFQTLNEATEFDGTIH